MPQESKKSSRSFPAEKWTTRHQATNPTPQLPRWWKNIAPRRKWQDKENLPSAAPAHSGVREKKKLPCQSMPGATTRLRKKKANVNGTCCTTHQPAHDPTRRALLQWLAQPFERAERSCDIPRRSSLANGGSSVPAAALASKDLRPLAPPDIDMTLM